MDYKVKNKNSGITVQRTYTITMEQVAKLSVMRPVLGKSQSEIVRDAIDHLYERTFDEAGDSGSPS